MDPHNSRVTNKLYNKALVFKSAAYLGLHQSCKQSFRVRTSCITKLWFSNDLYNRASVVA